jgi:hypothetical protein
MNTTTTLRSRGRALLLPLSLLFLAACGSGPAAQTSDGSFTTRGQSGKLDFAFSSDQCALLGCSLDSPVLQGSMITIVAGHVDPAGTYTVAIDPPVLGGVVTSKILSCSYRDATTLTVRTLEPGQSCNADETELCDVQADIQTAGSGTATLQVLDANGQLLDSAPFTIAAADRIDTAVGTIGPNASSLTAGPDGAYGLHVGDNVYVLSTVYSAGRSMVYTANGPVSSYSNPAVVAESPDFPAGGDLESAVARSAGNATIMITAVGASATVALEVAP